MSEEVQRHVVAVDSGRGADGPPAPALLYIDPTEHDHNYIVSRAITLGLNWNAISPAFVRYGEGVLNLARDLRQAGFSASWVQELIQVGGENGMLVKMLANH